MPVGLRLVVVLSESGRCIQPPPPRASRAAALPAVLEGARAERARRRSGAAARRGERAGAVAHPPTHRPTGAVRVRSCVAVCARVRVLAHGGPSVVRPWSEVVRELRIYGRRSHPCAGRDCIGPVPTAPVQVRRHKLEAASVSTVGTVRLRRLSISLSLTRACRARTSGSRLSEAHLPSVCRAECLCVRASTRP